MKGNCGIVNGVVMPDCSKKIKPYPARTTQLSPIRYAKPSRGPKSQHSTLRAVCGKSKIWVERLNMAPLLWISVEGKLSVYRVPTSRVSRGETFQSSPTKNSAI